MLPFPSLLLSSFFPFLSLSLLSMSLLASPANCQALTGAGGSIGVQFGNNIASVVAEFTTSLLRNATSNSSTAIQVFPANVELNSTTIGSVSVVLSFGLTLTRSLLIKQGELSALGSEGYIIRSATLDKVLYLVGDGNALVPDVFNNNKNISNGAHYSLFCMLEILGFPFFHPLRITVPTNINLAVLSNPYINITEQPYWPVRGWHYHTQHLLELTDMFNGFGLGGTADEQGWQSFLPYYQSFLLHLFSFSFSFSFSFLFLFLFLYLYLYLFLVL